MNEEMESLQQEIEKQQLAVDKGLLQSFQQACQSQQIPQAMNYALRLQQTKSYAAAIKIANHFGRTSVARSLDEMLKAKLALEQLQAQMQMGYYGQGHESEGVHHTQQYSQAFGSEYQEMDASNGVGMLSRKASLKQQPNNIAMSKIVSPDAAISSESQQDKPKKSLNPFAIGSNNNKESTPLKRGMEESKSSPSPKKPALNVSPFIDFYKLVVLFLLF
jgi:hypothetical protein